VGLPLSISPFQVKRNAFSNKAFNTTEINTEVKVLGLAKTLMVFMKTIYIN
jgi:electron transfer flavoprotein alpha subunit